MAEIRTAPGHYERKQLRSGSLLIRFSHQRRFALARRLVQGYAGRQLLDYGCGDATFIAQVSDLFPTAVGADHDAGQIEDCRSRLAGLARISFHQTKELDAPRFDHAFDVVTCMEVLEHVIEDDLDTILGDLRRLISPRGILIVSVPIESGPALLFKQIVRICAGWRRIGDYQFSERYSTRELLTMVLAGDNTRIARPAYFDPDIKGRVHSHKGFNWRAMRRRVAEHFEVRRTEFSPLGFGGSLANSQAWLVCAPRPGS